MFSRFRDRPYVEYVAQAKQGQHLARSFDVAALADAEPGLPAESSRHSTTMSSGTT